MADDERDVAFCPRCDRRFSTLKSAKKKAIDLVIAHVDSAHPDYDPRWHETHAANHEGEK